MGGICMNEEPKGQNKQKQEKLKEIVRRLHDGVTADDLKKEFSRLIRNTSVEEIADMENALIREGFPPTEIQRLCDVHARVFEQSLKKAGKPGRIPGHPIYSFVAENREARKILKSLKKSARKLKKKQQRPIDLQTFQDYFQRLKAIEIHYQRKENQLFPVLEAKKFTGPTQVMWGKHDEIRTMIRELEDLVTRKEWPVVIKKVNDMASAIRRLIFLEEKILFPTSARKLNPAEWAEIKRGESEIGYAWITPSNLWDANLAGSETKGQVKEKEESDMEKKEEEKIKLSKGELTPDQVDLLLKHLPVDITFVDEQNQVCYYSDTEHRIFPRSPAVIGRKVQNCHPPKSVHIVNDIVKNFKEKKKKVAEFWIRQNEKIIYIRYFPVFDQDGTYRGVIEVSQEVSGIKGLEGERRLLDW
jgi:DUF438 domain-containing protein